ncbi:MAG: hypothetical protein ACREC3_05435 [Methyloceanibacter sp.]
MRRMVVGIAAALLMSFAGPAFAEDMTEEIQEEEQPGSEIELGIGSGGATIERKSGAPVLEPGAAPMMDLPNDPDTPEGGDPVDDELPGEGPENLSGPDDDDPLPE